MTSAEPVAKPATLGKRFGNCFPSGRVFFLCWSRRVVLPKSGWQPRPACNRVRTSSLGQIRTSFRQNALNSPTKRRQRYSTMGARRILITHEGGAIVDSSSFSRTPARTTRFHYCISVGPATGRGCFRGTTETGTAVQGPVLVNRQRRTGLRLYKVGSHLTSGLDEVRGPGCHLHPRSCLRSSGSWATWLDARP